MTPSKIIRLAAASSGMRIRATNVAKLLAGHGSRLVKRLG
jgi:hypothetical protein